MASVVYADLSGEGFQPFTTDLLPVFERVAVTNIGHAEPLDTIPPIRYIRLGWWAFYEEIVSNPDVPDGKYLSQYHWLTFTRENWNDRTPVDAQGASGFFYRLGPLVTATFWFYWP